MWIATIDGFYSAVQHRERHEEVMVRARSRKDLVALCARALEVVDLARGSCLDPIPDQTDIEETLEGADYPYRLTISKLLWSQLLVLWSTSIDYDNFKNAVARHQGRDRAHTYHAVWAALLAIEHEDGLAPWLERDGYDELDFDDDDHFRHHPEYPGGDEPRLTGHPPDPDGPDGELDDEEYDDGVDHREADSDAAYTYRTIGLGLVERTRR